MLGFAKIIGVGLLTLICYIVTKQFKPEFALLVSVVGSFLMLIFCIDMLNDIFSSISSFVELAGINNELFVSILKIVGIGYLTEFSSQLCADAGNNIVSEKIIFAGKIFILFLSLPIITSILNIITGLL